MTQYPGWPRSIDVPAWFVDSINRLLDGASTRVIPKGGAKQIDAFLTRVERAFPDQQEASRNSASGTGRAETSLRR